MAESAFHKLQIGPQSSLGGAEWLAAESNDGRARSYEAPPP